MATTLLELAEEQKAARLAALQSAQTALDSAQAADKVARTAQAQATAAALDANSDLDAARKQLAVAQTPAEIAALSIVVRDKTVAQRQAADALVAADFVRTQAGADFAAAQRAAANAARFHEVSATAQDAAQKAADRRDEIDTQLGDAPLADVVANATAALASQDYLDAKARIENALPAALRTRAFERAQQTSDAIAAWQARVEGAQSAFDEEIEASGVDIDGLSRLQRELSAADAALSRYVSTAVAQLNSATATLAQLAALSAPPLTPAQKTSLDDLQGTARPDAATAEKTRDDAALGLADAAATLRAERIKALAEDPTGDIAAMEADAATFPDLAQAKTDYDDAEDEYDAAVAAYTAGMQTTLARWQAEVPEPVWTEAASFYAAEAKLNALTQTPGPLVTAVTDAEADLLAAMETAGERSLRLEYAIAALGDEQALAEAAAKDIAQRRSLALRGALTLEPAHWL